MIVNFDGLSMALLTASLLAKLFGLFRVMNTPIVFTEMQCVSSLAYPLSKNLHSVNLSQFKISKPDILFFVHVKFYKFGTRKQFPGKYISVQKWIFSVGTSYVFMFLCVITKHYTA